MVTYTAEEVAKMLRVSVATIRRLIKTGEIEAIQVGNQYRITQDALDRYASKKR